MSIFDLPDCNQHEFMSFFSASEPGKAQLGTDRLKGERVAVQGVGSLGGGLCHCLAKAA